MVIYKSVPVVTRRKMTHVKKICGRQFFSFCFDYGDIPVGQINKVTGLFEPCENTRGYGYACRNRLRYRKKLKRGV